MRPSIRSRRVLMLRQIAIPVPMTAAMVEGAVSERGLMP